MNIERPCSPSATIVAPSSKRRSTSIETRRSRLASAMPPKKGVAINNAFRSGEPTAIELIYSRSRRRQAGRGLSPREAKQPVHRMIGHGWPGWRCKLTGAKQTGQVRVATSEMTLGRPMQGSARALCGRRVEVNIKSRDLAVARDDEIHSGVCGRFALWPRAPRQASRIVQNLRRAMRRINEMRVRRSEIAGELVQCVVTDESAGRHVQHTVLGI